MAYAGAGEMAGRELRKTLLADSPTVSPSGLHMIQVETDI